MDRRCDERASGRWAAGDEFKSAGYRRFGLPLQSPIKLPEARDMHRYSVLAFLAAAPAAAQLTTVNPPAAQANGAFGRVVAGVPDVNGDGFGDVVVGAAKE